MVLDYENCGRGQVDGSREVAARAEVFRRSFEVRTGQGVSESCTLETVSTTHKMKAVT
jgi:hypothetical protein